MDSEQRCGTCADWSKAPEPGWSAYGACRWFRRNMPASMRSEPDMHENEGIDCPKWSKRDD